MTFVVGSPPNPINGPTIVPGYPQVNVAIGVSSGQGFVYTNIPNDTVVGPNGLGPCIGLTIVSQPVPNGPVTVWVYHFGAIDNPTATINNSGPFPLGSIAYLSGGLNTEPSSMLTLEAMNNCLQGNPNITVKGYYNNTNLYVNNAGQLISYRSPGYVIEDPSLPHP